MKKTQILEKLIEIRDNMHKKTYLKEEIGSADLLSTFDLVLKYAGHTYFKADKETVDMFHHVLFRICSRLLSRIGWNDYPKKDEKKVTGKFAELCLIKNHYWKIYRVLKNKEKKYEKVPSKTR